MSSAMHTDTRRTIRRSLSRFCSIMLIVAIGVGFFAGVRATGSDMRLTADRYFKDTETMDLRLLSTLGFSENDIKAVSAVEGVGQVSGTKYIDCLTLCQDNCLTRVFSLPEDTSENNPAYLNRLRLLNGRMPESAGECVADQNILSYGFSLGDSLTLSAASDKDDLLNDLARTEYTIVGVADSPLYIDMTKRGTTTAGNGSVDACIYLWEENFSAGYYTMLCLTCPAAQEYNCYTDEYREAASALADRLEAVEAARSEERLAEMKLYVQDRLETGRVELEDARQQLSEGKQQLQDAEQKLADGRKAVADGEKELRDGRAELEKQKKQYADYEKEYEEGKAKLAAAEAQLSMISVGTAQLDAGKAQLDAILSRMDNLEEGSVLLPILASTLAPQLNELQNGLGDTLYDENGKVTPATVAATHAAVDDYFSAMRRQIVSAENEYYSGKAKLEQSRKDLDKYAAELEKAEKKLADGEKELADAREKLSEGEVTFAAESEDAYREIAEGEAAISRAEKKMDDAENALTEMEPAEWYIQDRGDVGGGFAEFGDDATRMDNLSTIFPVFFLAVAALVCLTTMARMVEEQRTEIGTLKALGYTEREIRRKYLIYSLSATVLGCALGLGVGFKLFPTVIYDAYCILYDMPPVIAPFHWEVAIACCGVALACVLLVTCSVCRNVLRETPASIMRPKAPPAGRRVLLERVPFLWRRLSFSYKVTVRNLFRYGKRVLMTVFGIAGSAALVLTGYGLNDAIGGIVTNQFDRVFCYDLIAGYTAKTPEEESGFLAGLEDDPAVSGWMRQYRQTLTAVGREGQKDYEVNLTVSEEQSRLTDFIHLQDRITREAVEPAAEGVVLTEKVATLMGLCAGDTLILRDGDNREYRLAITGVAENYASHFAYCSEEYYREIFGDEPEYNSVIINLADYSNWSETAEKLLEEGTVKMVTSNSEMLEQYIHVTDSLIYVVIVLIVSAALLAFVVLYNLSNINITERIREIATLKVLGFYDGEVSAYIYRENIILTLLGTALGLLLGMGLTRFVVVTAEIDSIMFGREIHPVSFLIAAALTCLFSFLVNVVMHFRLQKISMVESMKSVD